MRSARANLRQVSERACDNWALAFHRYLLWQPAEREGAREVARLQPALFVGRPVPLVYRQAYGLWEEAVTGLPDAMVVSGVTTGPLVYGVGDKAVHETGLTFQWTYGVPILRGSAVKGAMRRAARRLLALEELVGDEVEPDATEESIVGFGRNEGERERLRTWCALFGSPDGRAALTVHDAWLTPEDVAEGPLVQDVVTVHHPKYYQDGELPTDMDSPNPIPFLCVRSGVKFRFALQIDSLWHEAVREILCRTLVEEGLGAKTNAGYGRFSVGGYELPSAPAPVLEPTHVAICSRAGSEKYSGWKVDGNLINLQGLPTGDYALGARANVAFVERSTYRYTGPG